MHAAAAVTTIAGGFSATVAVETMMLELFAPLSPAAWAKSPSASADTGALWRSDAIHRAKNLAQLTLSLADLAEHPSRGWLSHDLVGQARCLARAYEELGAGRGQSAMVPCGPLLIEIATRLTAIFGAARDIHVTVKADAVALTPDVRRALLLMGSEMLINALKYAYPQGGGTIRVSLTNERQQLWLIVEDDGIGQVAGCSEGQGSALLDRLSGVIGATLSRRPSRIGHGYRISVSMPIAAAQAG